MLKCSILFIMKEIIIFMTACKLVIGNYKGLYNANMDVHCMLYKAFLATVRFCLFFFFVKKATAS